MTDSIDDEALLSRFRDWLREARAEAEKSNGDLVSPLARPGSEVGLYRLVEEFTAFRHEVKLETKSSRSAPGANRRPPAGAPAGDRPVPVGRAPRRSRRSSRSPANLWPRPSPNSTRPWSEGGSRSRRPETASTPRPPPSAASIEVRPRRNSSAGKFWYPSAWRLRSLSRGGPRTRRPSFQGVATGAVRRPPRRLRPDSVETQAGDGRRPDSADRLRRPADRPRADDRHRGGRLGRSAPGHVIDELRRGYTWRGRVLRYAEVRAVRERPSEPPAIIVEEDEADSDEDEAADMGAD